MTTTPANPEPTEPEWDWQDLVVEPDISHLEIEDGVPVDNIYSEKQQRLLTEPLYSSWLGPRGEGGARRPFFAASNVGVFGGIHEPPLCPDVLLSFDVAIHPDAVTEKKHRTYFIWEFGKPPDLVIEVVSNRKGGELGKRKAGYERLRVLYYVVWDPERLLRERDLAVWVFAEGGYIPMTTAEFTQLDGLSLRPWDGVYEGLEGRWLRWYADGQLIPTGAERAEAEAERAEAEAQRAEAEAQRAEAEAQRAVAEAEKAAAAHQRAERLAALLAAHGIDPDAG